MDGSRRKSAPGGLTKHAQQELLRITLASIGDGVIVADAKGHITFLNPVAQSLTGWTQDDAIGAPLDQVFKIVNEESRQPVENPAARALREGLVIGLANHTLLFTKTGTERPIDDNAAPIRSEKGEVNGVVLVFRDISERRRQEQAVKDALGYAENIIATLREPFLVVLDKHLRVVSANRSFHQAFQVSRQETEGQHLYDLGNRQWDIPSLRRLLEELLPHNGDFHDFEVEHDFPRIGHRVMLLNARRVRRPTLSNGKPELILLAIEDITERREAEARLQDSEVRFRRLFEAARDGILILDSNTGKITDANPFMTEILGYSNSDLMGKELWQIGLFRDKEASQTAFRQLQERGYIRYDNLPLETKDGRQLEVEFVSNAYQVDSQLVVQCNIRDISERRQLERTKMHAESLADLNRRKDEFLATLAHELRNPLSSIRGGLDLWPAIEDDKDELEQLRLIMDRQVQQLVRLIDDLMDVSRIAESKIQLRQQEVEIETLISTAIEAIQPLIDAGGHRLTVKTPAEPVIIQADVARLTQVFTNILNNAVKYTGRNGVIWIAVTTLPDKVMISIRDNGPGIPQDMLTEIFEMFRQVDSTLERSHGGLGIGLTLVKQIVELHGGTVEARSAGPGMGSEFIVTLPRQGTATVGQQDRSHRHLLKQIAGIPPHRVLVVDDTESAAKILTMMLRSIGQEVATLNDGAAAVEYFEKHHADVVFLDIAMPGMNGYDVARKIRQRAQARPPVLVALTGYGQDEDRRRAFEAGFNHHMTKPTSIEALQELLTTTPVSKENGGT
jgi:PAS domain S-box-containing protein